VLHYRVVGSGRPILFLHGVTLDHRYMMDIMEPVFEGLEDWKRVYVDLPGHGQSPARDGIRSQDDLLESVMGFADQFFEDAPFALVGLSRGSYIARGIIHLVPERVTGAALIVPGGNPSSDSRRLPKHQVLEPDPSLRSELSDAEIWAFDNMSVVQRRDIVEKRRDIIAPARQLFDEEQEARVFNAFDFSFREAEEASVFDKPSLIVAGLQDSISGYLDAVDLLHRFPRASLAVLDSAGHGLAWERPDVFRPFLQDWLARVAVDLNT